MGNFHNSVKRTARKEHICDCCKSKIEIGEEYENSSGVFYGDFYSYKLCSFCQSVVNKEWNTGYYEDGINIDGLLGDLEFNEEYIRIYRPKRNKSLWLRHILACWERDLKIHNLEMEISRKNKALGTIKKSTETIIRVDGLTKEMDSAITQEIFHIGDMAEQALKGVANE